MVCDLAAAERQQLTGQVRGPFGRRCDLLGGFRHLRFETWLFHQQARITLHDSEQIVKVMRDAGGQSSDGFHFLRLTGDSLQKRCRAGFPFDHGSLSAPLLFGADTFQRSAALVSEGLQRVEVLIPVGARRVTVDRQKPENPVRRPDGDVHERGRKPGPIAEQDIIHMRIGRRRTQNQLGALLDNAPHQRVGVRPGIGRGNLGRPAIDGVDVQEGTDFVFFSGVKVEPARVPPDQLVRHTSHDAGGLAGGAGGAQIPAQFQQSGAARLGPLARGHLALQFFADPAKGAVSRLQFTLDARHVGVPFIRLHSRLVQLGGQFPEARPELLTFARFRAQQFADAGKFGRPLSNLQFHLLAGPTERFLELFAVGQNRFQLITGFDHFSDVLFDAAGDIFAGLQQFLFELLLGRLLGLQLCGGHGEVVFLLQDPRLQLFAQSEQCLLVFLPLMDLGVQRRLRPAQFIAQFLARLLKCLFELFAVK